LVIGSTLRIPEPVHGAILAIAISRLFLHTHSLLEVGLGLAIGTVAVVVFGRRYLRSAVERGWVSPLFVTGAAIIMLLHGQKFDADPVLRAVAGYLWVQP
jgi:hypothetical protein